MAVGNPATQSLTEQLGGSFVGTRDDLEISRHVFFGETSYVVRDPITFDGHNLSPTDYEIFTNLTDEKSLNEICSSLIDRKVFDESKQESFYQYVVELQKRNLLSLPVTDGESLFQQFEQRQKGRTKGLLMKLLFLRIPLGCPDRFLKSTCYLAEGFFTRTFFCIWLIGLLAAILLIGFHWTEFTSDLSSALAIQNLPVMLAVMSVLKLWHELGHGYACRHYGVSVPNAGLLFMLGTPLAFMDATGSWSLPKRSNRQLINLAGIYFELMIAIVAAFVWVFTDNSFVKSIAHFSLLISSVTTIAFNINPLMKYDGYFVLADLLGIPNLKTRSAFNVQMLAKYVFFRIPMQPSDSRSLRVILVTYGIAASIYKISLTLGIAIMISMQIWIIGLAIGVYYAASSFGSMVKKLAKYLIWSEEIHTQRKLAICYLLLVVAGIPSAALFCPVPGRAQARGVVEPDNLAVVHAEQGGIVKQLHFKEGQKVETGFNLGKIENIQKSHEILLAKTKLDGLLLKHRRFRGNDLVQAAKTEKEITQTKFELASMGTIKSQSEFQAPIDGIIIDRQEKLRLGQYVEPGEELLRIGGSGWIVRAVANADSLADIKPEIGQRVHCRFVANSSADYCGKIQSISASGDRVVPYEALTHLAGGFIPVSGDSMEATEPFFEIAIRLDDICENNVLKNGLVCEVRFRDTSHTFGQHLYRSFLRFTNQINLN